MLARRMRRFEFNKMSKKIQVNCFICNKIIYRYANQFRRSGTGRFCCSPECQKKLISQINKGHTRNRGRKCIAGSIAKLGEKNPNWGGGRAEDKYYFKRVCKGHKHAEENGYVLEHILIAEKMLGRDIKNDEAVHHLDGNGKNNDIKNIHIMDKQDHVRFHKLLKAYLIANGHPTITDERTIKTRRDGQI